MGINGTGNGCFRGGGVNGVTFNLQVFATWQNDAGERQNEPFLKTLEFTQKTGIFVLSRGNGRHNG